MNEQKQSSVKDTLIISLFERFFPSTLVEQANLRRKNKQNYDKNLEQVAEFYKFRNSSIKIKYIQKKINELSNDTYWSGSVSKVLNIGKRLFPDVEKALTYTKSAVYTGNAIGASGDNIAALMPIIYKNFQMSTKTQDKFGVGLYKLKNRQ